LEGRGTGDILRPAFYAALALALHGVIFLIPIKGFVREEEKMTRGIRIKAVAVPSPEAQPPARPAVIPPPPTAPVVPQVPSRVEPARNFSVTGSGAVPGPDKAPPGSEGSPGTRGEGGPSEKSVAGRSGSPAETEIGAYLARLKSEKVQGWARESARQNRMGWKGTGKGAGSGTGWGSGGQGSGTGTEPGTGSASTQGGRHVGYLDPRVQMVVTSYPRTGSADMKATQLEGRLRQVPYPDIKVRKHEISKGWWNVYIRIRTDGTGGVEDLRVVRPETDGPIERIFTGQVRREVDRWQFPPNSEINVDVRFYVE
jgi:hypothetical protein